MGHARLLEHEVHHDRVAATHPHHPAPALVSVLNHTYTDSHMPAEAPTMAAGANRSQESLAATSE